jgi:glutamate dehydrogenase
MTDMCKVAKEELRGCESSSQAIDFIDWITDKNFIFLGAKEFDFKKDQNKKYFLSEVKASSLGVSRSQHKDLKPTIINNSHQEILNYINDQCHVEIVKSRYKSQVHRIANAERIRIQKIKNGKVVGERRFIGLFTSSAYNGGINFIPLIKDKIAQVVENSGFANGSHNYKELISVLENYPRDELFQIDAQDLLRIASGIVAVCGRSKVKFFARRDKFNRFISCLIFVPKERSSSENRNKIREFLEKKYFGEVVDSFFQVSESSLTRLHIIIKIDKKVEDLDEKTAEKTIDEITKLWSEGLKEEVSARIENFEEIFIKYKNAFSISYQNRFNVKRAALDIFKLERCLQENKIIFNLYKSSEVDKDVSELKIYSPDKELILSEIMPILESFGFNIIHENTYTAVPHSSTKNIWIHYFHLNLGIDGEVFSDKIKNNFEEIISLIWTRDLENGLLNRLAIFANLSWKEIYLLRAINKYLYQTGFRYNENYISDILTKNKTITKSLIELFQAKFDPSQKQSDNKIKEIYNTINTDLSSVLDAASDLIIRRFLSVIDATLRTNYYQVNKGGAFKGYLSFKIDSKKIPNLPLPIPFAEIFVYSAETEAIHLRGGKVARGGLRWSDRIDDFRVEILSLVKAQTTKNAVIVPVGSKGGFVIKKDTSKMSRDEFLQTGIKCYKTFLRGLLDITDNVVNTKIIHPENVARYDQPDPYLVVAADKGTATFSDIANSISAEYNFWLGDAFASGGSAGYDHKKMGITAKGAWLCVQRHFREIGIDIQKEDFTCIGIGDLAGDVFGNGMLLSSHTKLIAAFNHLHIFLDPNPDVKKSFSERKRIFNLERSSWMDYNKSLISKGGGVFERSAKSIPISPEMRVTLGVSELSMSPNDLISAILKTPSDLLWNGGIGTYIKACDESHQDASDRANDALRVNGNELRCKVIGEGGNLGFTQKGRIEYALNGGRINTDALDNSAGVDCSDHEVNIKIALIDAVRAKKISLKERDVVLEAMTDEVAELVLSDNKLQSQAITIAQSLGAEGLQSHLQSLNSLEKSGLLNRKVEFLPSTKEIIRRQIDKVGLTRPELCVILAYSKMDLYNEILSSNLLEDEYFENELFAYFPKLMQRKFSDEINNHQLRREIIATQITNFIVNRAGPNFITQLCLETGFSKIEVVSNFIIVCDSFGLEDTWKEIERLDGKIPINIQSQMFLSGHKLLERSITWLLRNQRSTKRNLSDTITKFKKIVSELLKILPQAMADASKESYEKKVARYYSHNIPHNLSQKIASMDPSASAFDIAEISAKSSFDLKTIAEIYFAVGTRFSLKWLRSKLASISTENNSQKLAAKTILEDIYLYQMKIAKSVIKQAIKDNEKANMIKNWTDNMNLLVKKYDNFIDDLKSQSALDISAFVVALNRLKPLVS